MPRKPKAPEHIRCPVCGKLMLAESYAAVVPQDVAAERIHREYRPGEPYRTVLCTCGHYTIHSPYPNAAS